MKPSARRVLQVASATVAALALTVVAAAPSTASAPTDTIVIDPAQHSVDTLTWQSLDAAAPLADGERALVEYADGTASVVYANTALETATFEVDLRSFGERADAETTVYAVDTQAVITDAAAVPASGIITVTAPAQSVVAAVTTGLSVHAAEAPVAQLLAPETDLVGEAMPALLEASYAPGKTIELGNENAQQTTSGGATYTAPAAVFTISANPAAVEAQSVVLYPVTGAANTYVIATNDGRVLSRRANDVADWRYLQLTERTIADAAADAYARWTAVDAGNGEVYLHNVQPGQNGLVAALDLYNWRTADASEVQTYDAGTAAVQKWKIRSLSPTVAASAAVVQPGAAPTFPSSMRAVYAWGPTMNLSNLRWDAPDASVWQTEGTVTVTGLGTGFFGEDVAIEAVYTVGALSTSAEAAMSTHIGVTAKEVQMRAPRTIERSVGGSDQSVTQAIAWDWSSVTDEAFAAAGTVLVPGIATDVDATLVITVGESREVNILREGGVHYAYTHMDGSNFQLTNGVRDVLGFSDWRSGGAANRVNPNTVSFFLDEPTQVTGVSVFDIAGTQNIGGVTVEYRTLTGGWRELPGAEWPYVNETPNLSLETATDSVVATGVRVIITNKSTATWMSLSEIEVRGLSAVPAP